MDNLWVNKIYGINRLYKVDPEGTNHTSIVVEVTPLDRITISLTHGAAALDASDATVLISQLEEAVEQLNARDYAREVKSANAARTTEKGLKK